MEENKPQSTSIAQYFLAHKPMLIDPGPYSLSEALEKCALLDDQYNTWLKLHRTDYATAFEASLHNPNYSENRARRPDWKVVLLYDDNADRFYKGNTFPFVCPPPKDENERQERERKDYLTAEDTKALDYIVESYED